MTADSGGADVGERVEETGSTGLPNSNGVPEPAGPPHSAGIHAALLAVGEFLVRLPRWLAGVGLLAWMSLITWFSSWPAKPTSELSHLALTTNLGHAFLFGILAMWIALCLPRREHWPVLARDARLRILGLAMACGLLDELHQYLADRGRDFSLLDVVTDMVGAWCVLTVAAYVRRPGATGAGLVGRLALSTLACVAAAAAATWGPPAWPDLTWL